MKITEENLKKGKLTKNNTLKIGSNTYYFKKCLNCGIDYLGTKNSDFCGYKCSNSDDDRRKKHSNNQKGENNSFYNKKHTKKAKNKIRKGYRTAYNKKWSKKWYDRLSWCCNLHIDENNELIAKCDYCGKEFNPTNKELKDRHINVNKKGLDNSRLYCSNECKNECPVFNQNKFPLGYKKTSSREVQPELRKMVFERDNWTCQKCGSKKNLHCHHVEGIKWEPLESADIDKCITLCKKCHKEVHKIEECRTVDMQCIKEII